MDNNTDNTENAGIAEPYDLEVETISMTQPNTDSKPKMSSDSVKDLSEIDLSGYQYELVPTYKMIEDPDDQDTLFRIQFLQAFGITTDEYHPEIVSAVINDLYERYKDYSGIREILELHPLYNSGIADSHLGDTNNTDNDDHDDHDEDTPPLSPSRYECRITPKENNSEMIFCMMFSFHLFDLFHTCLRHAKHKEEIPQEIRDEIVECFRTTF
jgi:hypothetical protein